MRSKRGQFQHVFTFLMLIIIAGVVLLLGYKFISGILGQQCDVEKVNFRTTLEKQLRDYAKYGTVQTQALTAPCKAQAVCFVDAGKFTDANGDGVYDSSSSSFTYAANLIIQSEVQSPSTPPSNLFLVLENGATEPLQLFSEKVELNATDTPVLCVNATSSKFHVGYEGKGKRVVVTDAS